MIRVDKNRLYELSELEPHSRGHSTHKKEKYTNTILGI